jgi:hypothetical protein
LPAQKMTGESNHKSANHSARDVAQYDFWGHILSGVAGAISFLFFDWWFKKINLNRMKNKSILQS